MIYRGNLLKINGEIINKIVSYKLGRNKLWKNADRNMNGDVRAYLIGIYPKVMLTIGICNQEEIKKLTALFDSDFFTIEYYDMRVGSTITALYYANDYEVEFLSKQRGLFKPFTVNLIPVSKVRYD